MTNKMTKREAFTAIKSLINDPTLIAFLDHEIELLSKPKALTATQKANANVKVEILNSLTDVPTTISELMKLEAFSNFSNQKLSALMAQLVADGKVVRVMDKRKAYFYKA